MAFQSTIYSSQALGKPGTIARLNPIEKVPVVAESDVVAGQFVFDGTIPGKQVVGASASTAALEAVAGVAVFEKMQWNATGTASLNINDGEELALVRRGYVYVISATASSYGQVVGMDPATGTIKTAADAASLDSGYIDTGWVVETGNAAGQVCEIRK